MSMHHRRSIHRRQRPGESITLIPEKPTETPEVPEEPEAPTPKPPAPTPDTTKSTPTKPPPKPTPKPTETKEEEEPTPTETEDTATKTNTSASKESSSSTSASVSKSSSSSSSPTATIGRTTPLNTALNLPTTPVDTELMPTVSATSTSENSNSQTSGLGTGTIIGSVAGGVAAVVVLAIIISFFLRRYRSRRRAEEFDAAQFRRSAMIMDGAEATNSARPFSLFGGRWGGSAAARDSVAGDAGMAGHGAYRSYQDSAPAHGQPEMSYADDQTPTTSAGLQPRQQYTYGEQYDNAAARDDDYTNGAYSEQPQQQQLYNLDAYGDYSSYASNQQPQAQYQHKTNESRGEVDPYGGI